MNRNRLAVLSCAAALLPIACGGNQAILESGKTTPAQNAVSEKAAFETDLESMRTAKFMSIFSLRRKDGGELDAEDRAIIRVQTSDANRRVSTDDGRAILIGSNYTMPEANMTVLRERFVVQDFSPPPDGNGNVNVNRNR